MLETITNDTRWIIDQTIHTGDVFGKLNGVEYVVDKYDEERGIVTYTPRGRHLPELKNTLSSLRVDHAFFIERSAVAVVQELPETYSVETLIKALQGIKPDRPVYIRINGERYNLSTVKDRVTDCVELTNED